MSYFKLNQLFQDRRTRCGMPRVFGLLSVCTWSGRLDIGLLPRWSSIVLELLWNSSDLQVLLAPSLARDPTLITSIRYLASGRKILDNDDKEHFCSDKKNGFRNFVMSVMVELGVHKRGDPLDPDGLKAKLVFGITQLIYTIITIIPVSTKYFWWKLYFSIFMISLSRPYFSSPPTLSPAAGWSWLTVGEPGTGPAITLR